MLFFLNNLIKEYIYTIAHHELFWNLNTYICALYRCVWRYFSVAKQKFYIPKWATNWQKGGYKVLKKYPIILYSSLLYYKPVPTFLLIKLCKKNTPKNLSLVLLYIPGFCSCHVVVFLNQEKWIWCIACNKWNVFQIPIMSPQVKETMLGQHSKHTLAQTVL